MLAQLEQIAKVLPFVGVVTALIYWTGRWYKEQYYNQFSTNYNSLKFDRVHYFFASWNTILTGICFLMILFNIALALYILPEWYWILFTFLAALTSLCILLYWPLKFDPNSSFVKKLLAAREFSLQFVGWGSLVGTLLLICQRWQQLAPTWSNLYTFLQDNLPLVLIVLLIFSWAYLGLVGFLLGQYHGQAAIKEGRM